MVNRRADRNGGLRGFVGLLNESIAARLGAAFIAIVGSVFGVTTLNRAEVWTETQDDKRMLAYERQMKEWVNLTVEPLKHSIGVQSDHADRIRKLERQGDVHQHQINELTQVIIMRNRDAAQVAEGSEVAQ